MEEFRGALNQEMDALISRGRSPQGTEVPILSSEGRYLPLDHAIPMKRSVIRNIILFNHQLI